MFHRQPIRKPDRRTRVALRFDEWPQQDQERWNRALREDEDIFADAGLAARWRPTTRQCIMDAYGRCVGELALHDPLALEITVTGRVTRDRIA
jgi:hypothetical protein